MIVSDCSNYPDNFAAIYNNDGSVAASPFSISAVSKSDFPQSMATALSDNTFAVLYKGEPGADYSTRDERFRLIQPAGALGGETIRRVVGDATIGSIHGLVDGGFLVKYDNASFPYATLYIISGSVLEADRLLDTDVNGRLGADPVAPDKEEGFFYINDLTWQEHLYNIGSASPAPTAATDPASAIGSTGATLNGTVNANNADTIVTFEYGLTTSYGTTLSATLQNPVTGTADTAVAMTILLLAPNTTYRYRVTGQNVAGTTYGSDQTFTSLAIWPLTVTKIGRGEGTVTSSPAGIDCGNDCTEEYDHNTVVTLTATPDNFSRFTVWSGDADCEDGIVTMSGEVNCTTNFYRFAWWLFFDVITRNPPQP